MQRVRRRVVLGVPMRSVAAVLAIAAGLIHFAAAPMHFAEAFEFGLFMVIVGALQVVGGALLALRPSRWLVLIGLLGTVVVFVIFAVAYTVGLPFGPDPGKPEELEPLVIISKVTEFALLLALAALISQGDGQTTTDRTLDTPGRAGA